MTTSAPVLVPGGRVKLVGRGAPWVWDAPGPEGAPTVLLLHGWTSTAALNWSATMVPLSRRFRVLAPDQRGHGRGIRSRRPFRLEDCADDAAALVEAKKLGQVIVVGYSMGGAVAQLMARRHPRALQGMVLSATAGRFSSSRLSQLSTGPVGTGISLVAAGIPGPLRQAGLHRLVDRRTLGTDVAAWAVAEWKTGDPAAMVQAGIALASFDSTGWIGDITVPTVVLVTTEDATVPPRLQSRLAESIPGAVAWRVSGNHRACVDQASSFVPTLAAACRRLAGVPAVHA